MSKDAGDERAETPKKEDDGDGRLSLFDLFPTWGSPEQRQLDAARGKPWKYPPSVFANTSWEDSSEESPLGLQESQGNNRGRVGGRRGATVKLKRKDGNGHRKKKRKANKKKDLGTQASKEPEVLFTYPFPCSEKDEEEVAGDLTELNAYMGMVGLRIDGLPMQGERPGYEHCLTITGREYSYLDAPEYWNDNLIDLWLMWVTRKCDLGEEDVHIFSSYFYEELSKEGPQAVEKYTSSKRSCVNLFQKKLIFIPVNGSEHWSLCVVTNPGRILQHRGLQEGALDSNQMKEGFPCLMHFDSLKMHATGAIARNVRWWLNYKWERAHPDKEKAPFTRKSMVSTFPVVPRQTNACDCGVFLCRYAFALLRICYCKFSYEDAGVTSITGGMKNDPPNFPVFIGRCKEFEFDGEDVARMRNEMKTLIDNLTAKYKQLQQKR